MKSPDVEGHAFRPSSLIRSKLHPPPQAAGLLRRGRLIDLIGAGQARVTVVQAPSGYGKSTLLAQSYESFGAQGVITAWLSLDEDDRDASLFVAALIAAFGAAGVELGSLLTAAEAGLPATRPRSALAELLNPLNSLTGTGILFIDDLHRAQTPETAALLQTFQSNLSPNLRLVIAGRTRPEIDLAKLAAQGELRHVAAESLRFTADEARHQFEELDADQLQNIMRHTDGWPVALQLARICLIDRDGGHGLERFTGRTPELAAYLAEQVFSDLPQVLQDALMAIAFVERINGDLINALCQRTDGWRLLEEIESRNLFVSPLDEEREWFQFHKVFSDFLQERCRRHGCMSIPDLHRIASNWFLDRGYVEEATRHASLAEDPDLAARLLERAGGWRVLLRGGTSVTRVLTNLSAALAGPHSRLELCRVVMLAKEQQIASARAALEELRERSGGFKQWREGPRNLAADGFLIDHVLRIYEDREADLPELAALEAQMHQDPVHDNAVLALVNVVRAQASYAVGDLPAARRLGEAGIARCRSVGAGYIEIFGHLNVGLSLLAQGQLSRAENTVQAALDVAERVLGPGNNLACPLSAVLAEISYERGDLGGTRQLLDAVLPEVDQGDVWFDILASICSTDASLAAITLGTEAALQRLDEMADLARRRKMPRLCDFVLIERMRVLCQRGRPDAAAMDAGTPLREIVESSALAGTLRFRLWAPAVIGASRFANAQARPKDALAYIDGVVRELARSGQVRLLVPAYLQRAIAHFALGERTRSLEVLRATFELGVPREFRRAVIDECVLARPLFAQAAVSGEVFSWAERAFLQEALAANAVAHTGRPAETPLPSESRVSERGSLSRREAQILSLLVDGHTNKEMARQLEISESTVVTHRRRLYKKLKVTSRSKAIAAARLRPAIT